MNKNITLADDAALLQLHQKQPQRLSPLKYWWSCHLRAFFFACGDLVRQPFSSLMTILVISIAFALPLSLFALLQNVEQVTSHMHNAAKLSIYLKNNVTQSQTTELINQLKQNSDLASVQYISPQEGLKSLQDDMTQKAITMLGSNPLPGVIVLTFNKLNPPPLTASTLNQSLQSNPSIAMTQLNLAWIKRLYYLVSTLKQLVLATVILFCIGLVLIVGNTIRLDMKSHRKEISILRLIGATKSFIKRPLLYKAIIYGASGAIIAWILSSILLWFLEKPVNQLALTYNNSISLQNISLVQGIVLILFAALLSYIGASIATKHHFKNEIIDT